LDYKGATGLGEIGPDAEVKQNAGESRAICLRDSSGRLAGLKACATNCATNGRA
jgi:hypothetical protein